MDNKAKQYFSGQASRILQIVIASFISICFPHERSCIVLNEKISLDSLTYAGRSTALERLCFFEPGDTIPNDYTIFGKWAKILARNPDLCVSISGTASRTLDRVSEKQAWELANARSNVVRKKIFSCGNIEPSKITINPSYIESNATTGTKIPDVDESSNFLYDLRTEIIPYFNRFSPRKFIPLDRKPFWRESYKIILNEIDTALIGILHRNPDAVITIQGFGFKRDGYEWLEFLKNKIISRIGKNYETRIYICNWTGYNDNPFAILNISVLVALPSGKWQKILSSDSNISDIKLICANRPNSVLLVFPNNIGVCMPELNFDDTLSIDIASIPIMPGKYILHIDSTKPSAFTIKVKEFFDISFELELARKYSYEQDFYNWDGIPMSFVSNLLANSKKFTANTKLSLVVTAPDTSSGILWLETYKNNISDALWHLTGKNIDAFVSDKKLEIETKLDIKSIPPFRILAVVNFTSER